jgi:ribose transport system substrate-binding protein
MGPAERGVARKKGEPKMRLFKLLVGCAAVITMGSTAMGSALADTFALVNINQQALFFNQINEGAQKAADAAGAKLVIFNANNVPSAQNDAIENYITQKVDGIILVAIDVNGVKPAITAAKTAGIPVIAIDAQIPDGDNIAFIGVDNTKAGGDIGKFYADYVKSEMGGTAKIGIVGALNSFIQNQRLDGFKKAVTDSGQKITFLDTVDGQNVQETALSASENLMTANPDMTTLYATGEPALLGAVSAVTSQGRTGDVKVFGWDLTKQAVQGIDDGWVTAVVQQDPAGEGKAAVEALIKLKKGETVEPIINIPVTIVTKKNVDQYRAMFK